MDGDSVELGQHVIEMDTTAARARLDALLKVREQVLAEILLSKSQLGFKIDTSSLTPNQILRLESLHSERESRLSASRNNVKQSEFQLQSLRSTLASREKSLALREVSWLILSR